MCDGAMSSGGRSSGELQTPRPAAQRGSVLLDWMFMLTGGEQDNGWGGRGSLLISHNPPLCFGPTQKHSPEQIHTSPTVPVFRIPLPPLPFLPVVFSSPLTEGLSPPLFSFLLCLFSKIKGSLSGAVNVHVDACRTLLT